MQSTELSNSNSSGDSASRLEKKLDSVIRRLDRHETKFDAMEQYMKSSEPSSSTPKSKKVPKEVRVVINPNVIQVHASAISFFSHAE